MRLIFPLVFYLVEIVNVADGTQKYNFSFLFEGKKLHKKDLGIYNVFAKSFKKQDR